MDGLLSINETTVRLASFLGVLLVVAVLEAIFPRRAVASERARRWPSNIGISIVNQLLVRVLVPVSAAALAIECTTRGWGLLNLFAWPVLIEIFVAILLLDLAIYWQHRIFHLVPPLWRLHRMHHADRVFDVTTGIRFHPLSILVSVAIKLATIVLLGPSVLAVILFEILLNATSLFNHSNLFIPVRMDKYLRLIVVTPDMHRVHHSTNSTEMNCNFGFNFPWWDRIFKSYRVAPKLGHAEMKIGLPEFRSSKESRLDKLLTQPFREK